ncbi:MAG: DNA polymerase/3'-5' exonuclease PolX [Saprospiraceae bacterium]|nr:DNA polymerase/3'-5' exonuclease PolX [Saprospiraceae bacterium]HMW38966.1 helix-hairpin-helix domain-containing protein [Saprospiraceae bacterium]HMX87072.1 helix-hairpin-helix domain-containing protein [Saprospiraceae bacterium]HMZ38848.1 helix-hairpin-helix domain-containing protein [Saprospiraceae bacterium]HNA64787.1 helix-hairpin-helix domain-containing protein [Saprospiraceae bacterium]
MTNKEIADQIQELGSLMELHGENEFKTRTYSSAYLQIKKQDLALDQLSLSEIQHQTGLGKSIAEKIVELSQTGKISVLEKYRALTPSGVREMFKIKGVGPKKVKIFWQEMGLETVGELLYACKENRLIAFKGFGPKIQEDIQTNIEYLYSQNGYFLLAKIRPLALEILNELRSLNPSLHIELTGDIRRLMPIIRQIEFLSDGPLKLWPERLQITEKSDDSFSGFVEDHIGFIIFFCDLKEFGNQWLQTTSGSSQFAKLFDLPLPQATHEEDLFSVVQQAFIPPECRDLTDFSKLNTALLVQPKDIKGVIHTHSTWSDGLYDIRSIAMECIRLGYQYLVITDHSKSAVYANGLSIERVEMQWREIDAINKELEDFHIYKGIESDILSDGCLDYPNDILSGFDLVIASIHSNLKMDEDKAMIRLIKAIENPFTRILGHLTGRLLLARKGYPVDHIKLIDCCAANHVAIELNANPVRLDIGWEWLPYAQDKGVLIAINPDAHNLKGITDIQFGIEAARKGGLNTSNCLNCMDQEAFKCWQNVKKAD